jgi:pilus assembly protein FimV
MTAGSVIINFTGFAANTLAGAAPGGAAGPAGAAGGALFFAYGGAPLPLAGPAGLGGFGNNGVGAQAPAGIAGQTGAAGHPGAAGSPGTLPGSSGSDLPDTDKGGIYVMGGEITINHNRPANADPSVVSETGTISAHVVNAALVAPADPFGTPGHRFVSLSGASGVGRTPAWNRSSSKPW